MNTLHSSSSNSSTSMSTNISLTMLEMSCLSGSKKVKILDTVSSLESQDLGHGLLAGGGGDWRACGGGGGRA